MRIRGDLGNFYNVGLYEIFAKDVLISTVASSPFACETPLKFSLSVVAVFIPITSKIMGAVFINMPYFFLIAA